MGTWQTADHISDALVDVLNSELGKMKQQGRVEPLQLLCGYCLAFHALLLTSPTGFVDAPVALVRLQVAVTDVLNELLTTGGQ